MIRLRADLKSSLILVAWFAQACLSECRIFQLISVFFNDKHKKYVLYQKTLLRV